MPSHRPERLLDRSDFAAAAYSYPSHAITPWDRLLQPSILVPLFIVLFSVFYQSLHTGALSPFVRARWKPHPKRVNRANGANRARHTKHTKHTKHTSHPGSLLWDLVVAIIPARLLYALDHWLHPPLFDLSSAKDMSSTSSTTNMSSSSSTTNISSISSSSTTTTTATSPPRNSHAAKSELLRRILSMDSPHHGIMSAVAHAGKSISSLSSLSSHIQPKQQQTTTDRPPGLVNYDNSCFQNSILQSLSSLRPFPAYLTSALEDAEALCDDDNNDDDRDDKSDNDDNKNNDNWDWNASSVATLRDLLAKLTDAQNNGATLWTPKKLKSLDTWQQQDAQEYYSKILDEVDKEVTKVAAAQQSRRSPGLEAAGGMRDDTAESQHSDDSGYQSLSTLGKPASEAAATAAVATATARSRRTMTRTTTAKNPLEGLIAQRVACVRCGYSDGLSMIPFNCVTLSLGVGQGARDLYERLDAYTALESIQGVECAKCTLLKVRKLWGVVLARDRADGVADEALREPLARLRAVEEALEEDDFGEATLRNKCKIPRQHRVSSTKTKQMVIGRPPSSLAIHINRSVFDENTGQMWKNLAAVRFPSTLDLGPWCLGSAGPRATAIGTATGTSTATTATSTTTATSIAAATTTATTSDGRVEQWSSDPESSMVSGDLQPSTISGPLYELRAVITHQGRHENGHYVCYRKHPIRPVTAEKSFGGKDVSLGDRDVLDSVDVDMDHEDVDMQDHKESDTNPDSDPDPDHESDSTDSTDNTDSTDKESKWWRLSDENVWEVDEESVLAQGGVFMLFYDCVDPHPVLVCNDLHQNPTSSNDDDKSAADSGMHEADTDTRPNTTEKAEGEGEDEDEGEEEGGEEEADPMQSTPCEPSGLEGPEAIVRPTEQHSSCPEQTTALHADLAGHATTSLLCPLLHQNEDVDPMIPQHWPNS